MLKIRSTTLHRPFLTASRFARAFKLRTTISYAQYAVLLTAFAALCVQMQGNLPYAHEVDENDWVQAALNVINRSDHSPAWFGHPGGPYIYALAAIFRLVTPLSIDLPQHYFLGRYVNVACFLVVVALVRRLCEGFARDRVIGFVASTAIALDALSWFHTLLVRNDVFGMLGHVTAVCLFESLERRRRTRAYVVLGMSLGFCLGTKFLAIYFVAFVFVAILARQNWSVNFGVFLAAITCAIAFFATNPRILFELPTLVANLQFESRTNVPGADRLGPIGRIAYYFGTLAMSIGLPVTLGLICTYFVRRMRMKQFWVLCIAGYALFLSALNLHWHRYWIPMLPIIYCVAVPSVFEVVGHLKNNASQLSRIAMPLMFLTWTVQPITAFATVVCRSSELNSRQQALKWVINNVAPSEAIVQEAFAVPDRFQPNQITTVWNLMATPVRESDGAWIITSSWISGWYFLDRDFYAAEVEHYDQLLITRQLRAEFRPSGICLLEPVRMVAAGGPVIRIYGPIRDR